MNATITAPAPRAFSLPPYAATAFTKAEEVGPPKCIMIHGDPGTQKTSIMGSLIKVPGFNRGVIVDIDNGTEVFANDPEIMRAIHEGRLNIIKIDKRDPNAFGMLDYYLEDLVANNALYGYDFIGLDTLDVAHDVAADHFMSTTFNEKGQLDPRKAWGFLGSWTTDKMWALQNGSSFTGITVMHTKSDGEDAGSSKMKPKLTGGAKDSIAGIPSLVAYVEFKTDPVTKETHLVATVGKSGLVIAKNRYSIDEPIVDFDMPVLFRMIEAKIHPAAPVAAAPLTAPPAYIPTNLTAPAPAAVAA